MTIRETTISKLQQLPESTLKEVSDFIDLVMDKYQSSKISDRSDIVQLWSRWFESVDDLETSPYEPETEYTQLLLNKYRQQGLNL